MGLTNMKGDLAELKVAAKFLEKGCYVSYPFGDDTPYDLVVDMNGSLTKIQVKHISDNKGILTVKFDSNTGISYKGKVDYVVIYEPKSDRIFMLNPNEFNSNSVRLRIEKTKNNQSKNVIFADDYLLK